MSDATNPSTPVQDREAASGSPLNPVTAIPDLEAKLQAQESRLAKLEAEQSKKEPNTLLLTILGGIGAALLAIINNFSGWYSTNNLEEQKFSNELQKSNRDYLAETRKSNRDYLAEQTRFSRDLIMKVFAADVDPKVRRDNFMFLLDTDLIPDGNGKIRRALSGLPLDQTPAFPTVSLVSPAHAETITAEVDGIGTVFHKNIPVSITSDGPGSSKASDPEWSPFTALRSLQGVNLDARQIPFIGLSRGVMQLYKIRLGDPVFVFDVSTHKQAYAVVGDLSPPQSIDLSVNLADTLGIKFNLKSGSVSEDKVVFVVFAGEGKPYGPDTVETVTQLVVPLYDQWGGEHHLQTYLPQRP